MTSQEWNRIKAIQPPAPRYFWKSGRTGDIQGQGTYNAGINKAKRERREWSKKLMTVK